MRLLTTTAIAATLAATSAFAESSNTASTDGMTTENASYTSNDDMMSTKELSEMQGNLIRSRDITGGTIYTKNEANGEGWDADVMYDEVGSDWNDIGEIEDLVLSKDGDVIGIIAEVGGFLDIADKHVMISVSDLSLVAVDDKSYAYVTKFNEEDLEEMKSVDEGFWN